MKRILVSLFAIVALLALIPGCGGGGGGGGTATVQGRVLNVQTGAPPNPQANVSLGGGTAVQTSSVDGSFAATGPAGSTALSVDTSIYGIWSFTIPPAIGNVTIDDALWVGPEQVTLKGRVVSATDGSLVQSASVSFAGRTGTTNSIGVFQLQNVAYSSSNLSVFWGIIGKIKKSGYIVTSFTASPFTSNGGVVDIGDVLITSLSDPNPPGNPYNIYGRVFATGGPSGTVVTLKLNGTAVRIVNVGSDAYYYFWVNPGDYMISYQKGGQTAPDEEADLTAPNQVIHIPDVTLH